MSSAYEIRVHGEAPARVLESLCADVDMEADTVLQAVVEDQATLQALLAQIRDSGLEIVHLHQLP